MKNFILALVFSLVSTCAFAQTSPNLSYLQVLTPGQLNSYFAGKQDYLGASPLLSTGGHLSGKLWANPSNTAFSGLNLGVGVKPTSPQNGDMWISSGGLYFYNNNVVSGPVIPPIVVQATNVIADGVTDNVGIIQGYLANMPAGGGVLQLPAGNIFLNTSAGSSIFIPPPNVCIVGQGPGATTLIPTSNIATTTNLFSVSGANSCFRDFGVNNQMSGSGAGIVFLINASNTSYRNLLIEGNATAINGHIIDAFELGNLSFSGMYVDGSTFRDLRWGLLRTNANTSTDTNIKFTNNWFYGNYADDLSFNAPAGLIEGVFISGNRFENNLGGPTYGTDGIMLGMASVHDYRIIGNEFVGTCTTDAVHLEQDGERITVADNTFNLSVNTCNGINILANYVGGTSYGLVGNTITGNVMYGGGTGGTGRGIWIENNGQTANADTNYTITGNSIYNFNYGIFDEESRSETIIGNVISGALVCLGGTRPLPTMKDNIIRNCSNAISFSYGGVLGFNSFNNNPNYFGVTVSGGGRITANGAHFVSTSVSVPTGVSSVTVAQAPISMNGNVSISALNLSNPYQANSLYNVSSANGTPTTVTISNASPAVVTWTGSNLYANQQLFFTTTGSLPTGLTANTPYYVISTGLTANTFEIATVPGGTAINTSSAGSGTQTATALVMTTSQIPATTSGGIALGAISISSGNIVVSVNNTSGSSLNADFDFIINGSYQY